MKTGIKELCMSEQKTKPTKISVEKFIKSLPDEKKRKESFEIVEMMKKITKMEPVMWGPTMIGFGAYHYKYSSGHEGDMFIIGFSPRKPNLVFYLMPAIKYYHKLTEKLGKYKSSISCLYIKSLDDVDKKVLNEMFKECYKFMKSYKGTMN